MLDELIKQIGNGVSELIERRVTVFMSKFVREDISIILSEKEAAAFLKVSRDTLASWRKRNLLEYAQYPKGRLPKNAAGEPIEDGLSDLYSYSVADLLNFRDKYLHKTPGAKRYHLKPVVSLAGPEIGDLKKAA